MLGVMSGGSPAEGDVIAGKYRLQGILGEGGMGCVYRAQHLLLGQTVALKFMHERADSDASRERFFREAKALMKLRSEHVVRVFDVGVSESNAPFIVLEYLPGMDLRTYLNERVALAPVEAVDFVLQVCEALAEAHMQGIVHRDLKPQNLFLTERPNGSRCVKLLDFGLSKVTNGQAGDDELTTSNQMLGSPAFASPEQMRDSRSVDERTDVWSLGIVLYMLLGGGKPFEGEDLAAICVAITMDPPRPLRERCPQVPPELEAVILRCLEKRKSARTPSVWHLANELVPFASHVGLASVERLRTTYANPRTSNEPRPESNPSLPPSTLPEPPPSPSAPEIGVSPGVFDTTMKAGALVADSTLDLARPFTPSAAPPTMRASDPVLPSQSGPSHASGRRVLVFAILPVVLLLGVGAAVWYAKGRSSVHESPATATSTLAAASAAPAPSAASAPPASSPAEAPVTTNASAIAPNPTTPASTASRDVAPATASRPVRRSGDPTTKKREQRDRNGVPIVE